MVNHKYKKIKNQVKKSISGLNKEVIKAILSLQRLRMGKIKLIEYLSLSLLIQEKQIRNLKKFYQEDLDLYVKNKPSYANFLKNLHNYGKLIKELLFNKIKKNLFSLQKRVKEKEILLFLDSTKLDLTTIKSVNNFKGHRYSYFGKPTIGTSSTGKYFGYKATILITEDNLLLDLDIQTAKIHDNYFLEKIIQQSLYFKNTKILADKGYINHKAKERLKEKQIALITPNRRNMKSLNLDYNHKEYKKRQGVERFFKKVKIDLNLNSLNFCHSDKSLEHKIYANFLLSQLNLG